MLTKKPRIIRSIFLSLSVLLYSVCAPAEELPDFKFGKLGKAELEITRCDIDTGAHAFFLFDKGISIIRYDKTEGFKIEYTRHSAIKILTQSGYDYAEFKIPHYEASSGSMEEKIVRIKAVTYNQEGNKVAETSLNKKDIFTEKVNENWSNTSFTMPNVKEGSVVEVEYTIISDFLWNLPSWRFQHDIPVKWSILEVQIPEYFQYYQEMKGYISLFLNKSNSLNGLINFTNVNRTNNTYSTTTDITNNQVNYRVNQTIMAAKDVPAFDPEPYIDAPGNYISMISYELQTTKFPNTPLKNYTSTWEEIGKSLNDDEKFGGQLSAISTSKEKVAELNLGELSEPEKAAAIYNFVKTTTKWDGRNSKYCDNLRQVYKTGVGNSGDINILLINLLDAAGLNVNPVLLKTRSSGKLPLTHPSLSSLDYVIAAVKTGNQTILLDATEDDIPFNFLPERCLNEKGILMPKNSQIEWIDLSGMGYSKSNIFGELQILENGDIQANINEKRDGHFAFSRRKKIDVEKEQVIKDFEEEHVGFAVQVYEAKNREKPEELLEEHITGDIREKVIISGDMIYFNPCLFEKYEENPFKIEERKYPVDFAYPRENRVIFTYTIPDTWQVVSLPEAISIKLAENGGRFIYGVQQVGNKITLSQSFIIGNSLFLPSYYKTLKEFFRQVVEKQQEQIVLKRI